MRGLISMTKKKVRPGNHRVANVQITKSGNRPDCVHHEVIEQLDNGVLIGVCQRCEQERVYTPTYMNSWKHANAA